MYGFEMNEINIQISQPGQQFFCFKVNFIYQR